MKHQILNRYTNAVLFECEVPDSIESGMHARYALERAVEADANLRGAYLSGANLSDANLRGAYLSGANLSDANLRGAYLRGAYLSDAYLSDANLRGAYLSGANLSDANLRGAYLRGAYLSDAYLRGANLSGAKWTDDITISQAPLQLTGLTWPVTILDAHMQIGCQLHALADWEAFDDRRIGEMSGREALRFWHSHKDALLGLARGAGRSFAKVGPKAESAPSFA